MRLVLCDEREVVDSMAITISHRIAAIQAFRTWCRSELKRVLYPHSQNPHPSQKARRTGHPDSRMGYTDSDSIAEFGASRVSMTSCTWLSRRPAPLMRTKRVFCRS